MSDIIQETIGGVSRQKLPRRKQAEKPPKDTPDTLAEVLKMFDDSWDYTKTLHSTWERDTNLYNNIRVRKSFQGVSDTFIPMAFSTIETMNSAITLGDLTVDFTPHDIYKYLADSLTRGQEFADDDDRKSYLVQEIRKKLQGGYIADDDLDAINALFDYYWDDGDWILRLEELVDEGLTIGQAAWWLSWDVDRPKLESVPFRDYIFDPTATDDDTCAYQGRRYLTTLDKLKGTKILNPKTQELEDRYENLSKLKGIGSATGDQGTDKQVKEQMLMGSTLGTKDGQIEIIEIVTEDRMYAIANRKVFIENIENVHKTQARLRGFKDMPGLMPGITWANYKKKSLLVGKSEIETFWQEQERLNDLANQKSDSITRALLQQKRIDPQFKQYAKMLEIPGAVLPIPANTVEEISSSTVPYQAFNEENSIKGNIREATAIDQIVKGVGADSDVTATEAKLQVASAGQRIEKKVKSLERGPLKQLARKVFCMIRLYIADPMIVPTSTNKGIKPVMYDPAKYTQEFVPHVQLSINAQSQKREAQKEAIEMYKILIQDPTNNLEAVKKVFLPKIIDVDKSELNEIITKPAELPIQTGETPIPTEQLPPEMAPMGMPV